jgi:hypothetical protein
MEERMPSKWSPKLSPDATGFIRFPAIRNIVPLRSLSCLPLERRIDDASIDAARSHQTFGGNDFAGNARLVPHFVTTAAQTLEDQNRRTATRTS